MIVFKRFSNPAKEWQCAEPFKSLQDKHTVWDVVRGKGLPQGCIPSARDLGRLDHLAEQLIQSKWALSTRISYNAWFGSWQEFASLHRFTPLPAQERWLLRYFTLLACYYSAATVEIAAASIVAVHRINNLTNPVQAFPAVQTLVQSIKKNGLVSSRSKKFVVDAAFVVKMCTMFVAWFPAFDYDLFHPSAPGKTSIERSIVWMRGVAIILLGLAAGLRAGEVTRLTRCCWEHAAHNSVFIHVKLAKNGKNGVRSGAYLAPDTGSFADNFNCIDFFDEYWFPFLDACGLKQSGSCEHLEFPTSHCSTCPPLFPTWPSCRLPTSESVRAVATQEVTSVVKQWAVKVGKNPKNFSAISFRRGSVSLAAAEKVARNIRQQQCRWRSQGMQDHYTVPTVEEQLEYGQALSKQIRRSKECSTKRVTWG